MMIFTRFAVTSCETVVTEKRIFILKILIWVDFVERTFAAFTNVNFLVILQSFATVFME